MHIVSMVKFVVGVVLLGTGAVLLFVARGQRGFNQTRQAGTLMLVAGAAFLAIGLGLLDVHGLT
jgi:hypothetical protein